MAVGEVATCVVEQCSAPTSLRMTWTENGETISLLTLELAPAQGPGGGTTDATARTELTLTHSRLTDAANAAEYGAGWEDFLDGLALYAVDPATGRTGVPWAEIATTTLPSWRAAAV